MVGVLKKLNILSSINKNLALTFAIIIFLTRITGDSILFLLNQVTDPSIFIWKSLTALPIVIALFFYFFKDINNYEELKINDPTKDFIKDFLHVIVLIGLIFIADLLTPISVLFPKVANNIFGIILIDFVSLYSILVGILTFNFFYKWLYFYRQKKTRFYLKILSIGIIICFVIQYYQAFLYPKSEILNSSSILIIITLSLIAFIISKNSWIITIPKSKKYILLFISVTITILSISLLVMISEFDSKLYHSFIFFMPGSYIFIFISLLFNAIYFFRILITSITSLPTSHFVEHQIYEIKTLEYLNRIIAETVDFDQLIKTVTELACNVSNADAAWTEVCLDKCSKFKTFTHKIDDSDIITLKNNQIFKNFIENLSKPILLSSIKEHKERIFDDFLSLSLAQSIIAIPIFSSSEKIGTIVVLHKEEYGFRNVDLNVLSAYSHNISIALENARLLRDSLEKESLKRELLIAKDIQQKLLPSTLPILENYSINCFTLPALEVGGDYYDVIFLKNGKPCILIGDVSGKGMNAAFYMAQLKGVVLAVAKESIGASDILKRINSTLYNAMEKQMFITLSALVIDDANKVITFARAGHMPTIAMINGKIEELIPKGMGIGLTNNSLFDEIIQEQSIQIKDFDRCILLTDGVIETKNKFGEEYSINSLKQILEDSVYLKKDGLIFDIWNDLDNFLKEGEQKDDMTILTLENKKFI